MIHSGEYKVSTSTILECVDPSEYAALAEPAKDGLRIILSCGSIDMQAGSTLRSHLLAIFPSGTTHDAILAKWVVT